MISESASRFVDGVDATVRPPQEMALLAIAATRSIWRQNGENRNEPVASAYRRLLGRDFPTPIMIALVHHEGRWKTVQTHPGGVLAIHDASRGGWEIRVIRPELRAALVRQANAAEALRARGGRTEPLQIVWGDGKRETYHLESSERRVGAAGIEWAKTG